jgi:hypothetical protein
VFLKPGDHFCTHLRQMLVAGILVNHAAEFVRFAVQLIERNELLFEGDDAVCRSAAVLVAGKLEMRPRCAALEALAGISPKRARQIPIWQVKVLDGQVFIRISQNF